MELLDFPIRAKKASDKIFVHVFGDIHRAALGCDHARLRRDIAQLKKWAETGPRRGELHYWIGNGDFSNAVGPKDKRFDSTAVAPEFRGYVGENLFQAEAKRLAKEFEPIKKYGIGIGEGNHERSIAKLGEFNPSYYIADKLNLPFLGYSSLVRFRISYETAKHVHTVLMYMHHGFGAARSKGAKANMLWSLRDIIEADVYVVGHVHELLDFPEARLSATRKGALQLKSQELLFVNNGTYLKAHPTTKSPQIAGRFNEDHQVHTDYAEMKGYRPSVIGHNGFVISLKKADNMRPKQPHYRTSLRHVDFR